MPDASGQHAAFYADPYGRFALRYWDGERWTHRVASADGTESADPIPRAEPKTASRGEPLSDAMSDEVWDELRDALAAYKRLVEDFEHGRIDEATFRREAVRAGVIVKGGDAWIIDLVNQQWHHYDGIQLRTLQLTEAQG